MRVGKKATGNERLSYVTIKNALIPNSVAGSRSVCALCRPYDINEPALAVAPRAIRDESVTLAALLLHSRFCTRAYVEESRAYYAEMCIIVAKSRRDDERLSFCF